MKSILSPKHLPYFGAIVQAILFSIAGAEYFPAFGWLVGLGGGAFKVFLWSIRMTQDEYLNLVAPIKEEK